MRASASLLAPRGPSWTNWARTQACRPRAIVAPGSEAELAQVLRAADARGEPVRPVGSGHSWTALVPTDGLLVRLDRLDRVLDVDAVRGQVTVEGGLTLGALSRALRARGLALPSLGSIAAQTVAGAIATGTHGSGARFGSLSSLVLGLRLVTPAGEVLDLDLARDPDRLHAAQVSLGCLGVVTRVTLRCEPDFRLLERAAPLPLDDALRDLDALVEASEHVKLWWLPHTDRVWWCRYDRTDRPASRGARLRRLVDEHVVGPLVFPPLLRLGGVVPPAIPLVNRAVARTRFRALERVAWGPHAFHVGPVPRHDETEWSLPRARAAEALAAVRDLIARDRLRVDFLVELRFAAPDAAWLGPAHGRATCHVGAYAACAPDRDRYFAAFEARMAALDGRPHWAKARRFDPAALRRAYPRWDDFRALRAALDPRGTLLNDLTRALFEAD